MANASLQQNVDMINVSNNIQNEIESGVIDQINNEQF